MGDSPNSLKQTYRFDVKFYDLGKFMPFMKQFPVFDILNKKDDRPTGYAYFYFEGTQQECDELHESLIRDEKWMKVIGVDDLGKARKPKKG